jgi:hypothetical protein
LKTSSYKLEELLEWTYIKDIDIIGINETNISEQQGKFLINRDSKYWGFWIKAYENKFKKSGVEIVISKI